MDMVELKDGSTMPEPYAQEYWAWVASESDRDMDDWDDESDPLADQEYEA